MEIGFNFSTHKVEKMYDYETLSDIFNYENDYLNASLNEGAANLEMVFTTIVSKLQREKNYSIQLKIVHDTKLEYEDYFTIFSVFTFIISQQGEPNRKGYLKVKDNIRNVVQATDFSMLNILNNNYSYGIIQLTIEDKEGYFTQWVQK